MKDESLRTLPLVLHIRDHNGSRVASESCLTILRAARVPQKQRVYLHSFLGGMHEIRTWKLSYPNVKFGICPKTLQCARPEVRQYFSTAPLSELLVESDAPYQQRAVTSVVGKSGT